MVLTNFEWWAHGDAVVDPNHGLPVNSQNVDMFNPRMVQQRLNTATAASAVSHISSNGYYGFSYVNAAHQPADNNSHTNNNEEQNITHLNNNNSNNNNNNITCVPNANDVNGMDVGAAVDGAAGLFSNGINTTKRCKKRYFVSDDDYAKCALLNGCDSGGGVAGMGMEDVAVAGIDVCAAAKRCRFDDDYSAAQYCNDFFSLPSTQIGTQACLMDTEDTLQQQQPQQVDVNMGATNNNNQLTTNTTSNIHFFTTQQNVEQQQQQEQQQQVMHAQSYQQQNEKQQQTPSTVVYQQQHNYQGHLHRANRDVSRCLLSHMI